MPNVKERRFQDVVFDRHIGNLQPRLSQLIICRLAALADPGLSVDVDLRDVAADCVLEPFDNFRPSAHQRSPGIGQLPADNRYVLLASTFSLIFQIATVCAATKTDEISTRVNVIHCNLMASPWVAEPLPLRPSFEL